MLRKLKLYGELAEFVGHKEFEIEASNIPKVISFLVNNFPQVCLLYTSPSPRDPKTSRMPSSA